MQNCIFCKIVNGLSPCFKIWENEYFMSFLSIYPNTPGFSVVISKEHFSSYIFDVSPKNRDDLIEASSKVAKILEVKLKVQRCAVIFEGLGVDHLHSKLVPLHGINQKNWKPIVNRTISTFFDTYDGYISSHDCSRMPDEKLEIIWKKIVE